MQRLKQKKKVVKNMFTVRTDLAVEAHKMYAQNARQDTELKGIKAETKREGNICVTTVEILDEHGEKAIGKPVGRYITIESPNIKFDTEDYEKTCGLIRDTIKKTAS